MSHNDQKEKEALHPVSEEAEWDSIDDGWETSDAESSSQLETKPSMASKDRMSPAAPMSETTATPLGTAASSTHPPFDTTKQTAKHLSIERSSTPDKPFFDDKTPTKENNVAVTSEVLSDSPQKTLIDAGSNPIAGDRNENAHRSITPGRNLLTAPPGQRTVAKTIMGMGALDLANLIQSQKNNATPPIRNEEATTRPPKEIPFVEKPESDVNLSSEKEPSSQVGSSPTIPLISSPSPQNAFSSMGTEATIAPSSISPSTSASLSPHVSLSRSILTPSQPEISEVPSEKSPKVAFSATIQAIKPSTGFESSKAESTHKESHPKKSHHGPSNLVLVILWIIALAAVGLVAFLYISY